MKFHLNQLSTTSNLASGDWYIMAFMGGGEKKGDDLEVNTETTINVIEKGKEFTTSCPFATTWRRIVKQGNKLKLNDESKEDGLQATRSIPRSVVGEPYDPSYKD